MSSAPQDPTKLDPVIEQGSASPGQVFWLFGLSGAGKSTLASALITALRAAGRPVLALDGDVLRNGLCQGLGFSAADRTENLRRAAEAAKLGRQSGLIVVASFITPLVSQREMIRTILGPQGVAMIHVAAPLEVCQQRDVKGLYARAKTGQLQQMTGLSSAFESAGPIDLVIPTDQEGVAASTQRLLDYALERLSKTNAEPLR